MSMSIGCDAKRVSRAEHWRTSLSASCVVCRAEFRDNGTVCSADQLIDEGRRRHALAQIFADGGYRHVGQDKSRKLEFPPPGPAEGVAGEALEGGVKPPGVARDAIFQVLWPIAMSEVVAMVKQEGARIGEVGPHPRRSVQRRRQAVSRFDGRNVAGPERKRSR